MINMMCMFGYTTYVLITDYEKLNITIMVWSDIVYVAICSIIALIIVWAQNLGLKEATYKRDELIDEKMKDDESFFLFENDVVTSEHTYRVRPH